MCWNGPIDPLRLGMGAVDRDMVLVSESRNGEIDRRKRAVVFLAADNSTCDEARRTALAKRLLDAWGVTGLDPQDVETMGSDPLARGFDRINHANCSSHGNAWLPGVQNSTLSEWASKKAGSTVTRIGSGRSPSSYLKSDTPRGFVSLPARRSLGCSRIA